MDESTLLLTNEAFSRVCAQIANALKPDTFTNSQVDALARVFARRDEVVDLTGSDIRSLLRDVKIDHVSLESTKYKFLRDDLWESQRKTGKPYSILLFIMAAMRPERFLRRNDQFENLRQALNECLAFASLYVDEGGTVRPTAVAVSLSEATSRAKALRAGLTSRDIHEKVLEHCRQELLDEDYFHSIHESAKGISDRIKEMTGLQADGATLIDQAFKISDPYIKINSLVTPSEVSEQNGFIHLLTGLVGMFRNTTAHELRVKWKTDKTSAEEVLTLISFAQRRLDDSTVIQRST